MKQERAIYIAIAPKHLFILTFGWKTIRVEILERMEFCKIPNEGNQVMYSPGECGMPVQGPGRRISVVFHAADERRRQI